jgi:hypothetical protein
VSSGWTNDVSESSQFHPTWGASRNSLTSDTTTAITNTFTTDTSNPMATAVIFIAPSAGTNYTTTLTDTFGFSDLILKSPQKLLVETYSITEVFSHIATLRRSFTDSITFIDSIHRLFSRTFSEAIQLIDVLMDEGELVFSEFITITEYFLIRKLLDPALEYFRRYILDLRSIARPINSLPLPVLSVTSDPDLKFFRQYLGKI